MVKDYILQNWPLILILLGFLISLLTTVFADKKTIVRMGILIAAIFVLSIIVFVEFYIVDMPEYKTLRLVLMSMRYSATPLIISLVLITLVKKMRWFIFLPAIALVVLDIISIFTGVVFSIDSNNDLQRGPLGFLPFIIAGLYSAYLVVLLIVRSNKRLMELIPIGFLTLSLVSGLIFPFIFHDAYASIFCVTIAIALFAYHEFSIHDLTKKDSLTGLLNRHAYYADASKEAKNIAAIVSIDMNGLKAINDTEGHVAGDEALETLALCFTRALRFKQTAYRVGGDEFIIICRKTTEEEVLQLVERIRKNVSETKYSCAVGYAFNFEGNKHFDDLLTESDEMMYQEKDKYYLETGKKRRQE